MDKIGRTKQELRLRSWMDMYTEYQASGKTVQAWCSENDVNVNSPPPTLVTLAKRWGLRKKIGISVST
ncbi:MAG: hypothetical protein K2H89_01550 [Oscillospiraceae bacterium]|nr:hypothetical protein [Oscillospiraceae bacterium]